MLSADLFLVSVMRLVLMPSTTITWDNKDCELAKAIHMLENKKFAAGVPGAGAREVFHGPKRAPIQPAETGAKSLHLKCPRFDVSCFHWQRNKAHSQPEANHVQ